MSLWIKICGNTSLEDARLGADAGADALGFVFAASPRRVSVEQVAAIVPHLPVGVEKIGVFVDAEMEEIAATVKACGLTGVQLHFEAPAGLPAMLRERLGTELRILGVVHFGVEAVAGQLARHALNPDLSAVLIDSRTATATGGTGMTFDWSLARETVFANAGKLKLIAAGGLNPANVVEAIATLRPWGVDAVSGVEAAPGRKDFAKVRDFIARARMVIRE